MSLNPRRGRVAVALSLLLFAFVYLVLSLRLKMGTPGNPGPGFVPLFIAIALAACTSVFLLRLSKSDLPDEDADESVPGKGPGTAVLTGMAVCMVSYPFLLIVLKFILSTVIACSVMMLLLKPKTFLASLLLSVAVSAGFYFIFALVFGVALPSGPIEELLYRIMG